MIHVGFGEYQISKNPDTVLVCFGLGSCVAVTMYDLRSQIGGMIHIVLPSAYGRPTQTPARFADTGIPLLVEEMRKTGADKNRLIVKLAGGAKILKLPVRTDELDVGARNVEMCVRTLKKLRLPIHGADTGGDRGRTVRLLINTGETFVRQREEKQV